MTITLRAAMADLFIVPISYVQMTDPVTNTHKKSRPSCPRDEVVDCARETLTLGRITRIPLCR